MLTALKVSHLKLLPKVSIRKFLPRLYELRCLSDSSIIDPIVSPQDRTPN